MKVARGILHFSRWIALFALGCSSMPALGATFTVGSDVSCTHATVEAALGAAAANGAASDEIRLSSSGTYTNLALAIDAHSVVLAGGFARCADSAASGRTQIVGRGAVSLTPILTINGLVSSASPPPRTTVLLKDLAFRDGGGNFGGALDVQNHVRVTLDRVEVTGNGGRFGGGASLRGNFFGRPLLDIVDSTMTANLALAGGAIYCEYGALTIGRGAKLIGNTARTDGGALHVGEFCAVTVTGDSETRIEQNLAERDGGGLFLVVAARQVSFLGSDPTNWLDWPSLSYNVAGRDGGAMLLSVAAFTKVARTRVVGNIAGGSGGAFAGRRNATLVIGAGDSSFGNPAIPCSRTQGCVEIAENEAGVLDPTGGGGAVSWQDRGTVGIYRAMLRANRAPNGMAFHGVGDKLDQLVVESSIIVDHRDGIHVFALADRTNIRLSGVTIANNRFFDSFDAKANVIRLRGGFVEIAATLLYDTRTLIDGAADFTRVDCVGIGRDQPVPPEASRVVVLDRRGFVDAAARDYTLREDAAEIDACPFALVEYDMADRLRGRPYVPAAAYRFDLGAFERHPLFGDGFEQ